MKQQPVEGASFPGCTDPLHVIAIFLEGRCIGHVATQRAEEGGLHIAYGRNGQGIGSSTVLNVAIQAVVDQGGYRPFGDLDAASNAAVTAPKAASKTPTPKKPKTVKKRPKRA